MAVVGGYGPGGFQAGSTAIPVTQVEISVSCRNLKDKDVLSKSDPMCVLFLKEFGRESYMEFGRTEIIQNTLNPEFVKKFLMNYFFEEQQKLRFELYDSDSASAKLDKHDFLGRLECTLGEIVGSPGNKIQKPLTGAGAKSGSITIRAEEVAICKENATIQFQARKLDKKDFFGKSDPFLVFYRCNEDGSWTICHKTEVVKSNLNPTWRPFTLPVRSLCNGDYDRSIKIECYDWDSDGSHDFIGEFMTNMKELAKGPSPSNIYDCINPKKKKKSYKNSGTIHLMSCKIQIEHTFLDYITGGTQLNFTVAIDFTASNGDPHSPNSLHYINPYEPNQYATALQAVGEIIQDYDSDKLFPGIGFGAKLPPDGQVSHEFFLNGHPNNPYCQGIQGLMQAYQQAIQTVQLYGPTNFSPVINHVCRFASASQDGSNYFVLLILTDGVITDMPYTKKAIIDASGLPLSVIIIGVGEADFAAMEELDADEKRLEQNGKVAERDIVQFVPIREFIGKYGNNLQLSKAQLAKEVLAEIPEQFLSYMKKRGIQPNTPQPNTAPVTVSS